MNVASGATTIAEGKYEFKTDVELIFGNERKVRSYVLRTSLEGLSVWKARNAGVTISPFEDRVATITKKAALIEGEVWVYGVNSAVPQDIVAAVKIAAGYFKVKPDVLLKDIYIKNLNAERETEMGNAALIRANKNLYSSTCRTLLDAAKQLGVSGTLQLHVFSKSNNPKIPQGDLVQALKAGGATSVLTDSYAPKVTVGDNAGTQNIRQRTNFHLATLYA